MNKLMSNLKLFMCLDNATLEKVHEIRIKVLFPDGKYDRNHPDDSNPNNYCFVFMNENTAVGTVRLDFLSDKVAAIRLVAILPECQGKKMGSEMIAAVEEYAKQHGVQKLVTNAAIGVERFYKSIGYVNEEWIDPGEGIARPTTPMVKVLVA